MLTLSSPAQRYGIICNEWWVLMPTDLDPFVPQIINLKIKTFLVFKLKKNSI